MGQESLLDADLLIDEGYGGLVDRRIRQPVNDGLFDSLPGRGDPIRSRGDEDDPAWWARRRSKRSE